MASFIQLNNKLFRLDEIIYIKLEEKSIVIFYRGVNGCIETLKETYLDHVNAHGKFEELRNKLV